MEAFETYLQQFPDYNPAVLKDIWPNLNSVELGVGDYLLRQGQVCKQIAFIESGLLRLFYLNEGKEVTNCFCREHTIATSYASFITNQASNMAIQAVEPTRLLVFSNDTLQRLYRLNPFWQQLGRMAAENELINSECHHRFLKHLTASERYEQILEKDRELLQRVPLNYLATYIQVAPETISRIRNKLARLDPDQFS